MSKQGEEKTFRSYTTDDAARYAQARQQYSKALYQTIISHHTSTGGGLDTVVDLGCGPGLATFKLAEFFDTAIGLDASEGMIDKAHALLAERELPPGGKPSKTVRFEVSAIEDISPALIPDSSVDLITAATCAHWFNMARFWPSVARILRPGGTVAIWCSNGATSPHRSTPNAEALNAVLTEIEDRELVPYYEPGNRLARELYASIPLPWTLDPPVPGFDGDALFRKEYGTDGEQDDDDDESGYYEDETRSFDLDTIEKMLATTSPVARWRQAHPEAVGTEDDVVRVIRRVIERHLHAAGVEKGKEVVRASVSAVLLMVKKL